MKQTSVVTVFLEHQGRIALFQRSQAVSTYQGCWAGISGYLEGAPEEHFKVELSEETGLTPYEYRLLRRAEPLEIIDGERVWLVHPFLCQLLAEPDSIRLDRENVEVRWCEPQTIDELETVPGLAAAYRAVSFEPVRERLAVFSARLKNDLTSGSRELAQAALEFLAAEIEASNAADAAVLCADIEQLALAISGLRPAMAAIATSLYLVVGELKRIKSAQRAEIQSLINRHLVALRNSSALVCDQLAQLIAPGSRILLHSYSSSVAAALPVLRELGCRLLVCEARPGLEGRRTAQLAAELGCEVSLITDAAVAGLIESIDLALLGCDAVLADGSVVNKAGSALFAASLRAAGRPVYFMAERRKLAICGNQPVAEEHDPDEVWPERPAGVAIINSYFDQTPARAISGILLEDGLYEPYQIRRLVDEILHAGVN